MRYYIETVENGTRAVAFFRKPENPEESKKCGTFAPQSWQQDKWVADLDFFKSQIDGSADIEEVDEDWAIKYFPHGSI